MKRILLIGYVLLAAMLTQSFAQDRRVSGTVTSHSDGSTLPGVQVIVKGTTTGTVTDINGKYELNVPAGATLVFQFIGMTTEEVEVGDSKVVNVAMLQDIATLQEVVVTGLGAATDRRKVAISVETVNSQELTRVPSNSLDGALIGRIPGAQIQQTSGQPGQQANIILRGINTLGTTQPLILVDGVQVNSSSYEIGTGNNSSRFGDLDMSNVERVEVVQGAAAATIYGAQGANGVIQIFTKKGKKGQKTDIRFNTSYGIDNALRGNLGVAKNHYFETNADGYIMGSDGVVMAVNPETGFFNLPNMGFDGTTLNNKPFKEQTYNHMDQYFVKNAGTFNNSLNITGATDKIDFAFGLSSLNQESVVYGNYDRYNLTANIGTELFKGFTLRAGTQLVNSKNTTGGVNNRNNIYSGISSALMVPQFVDITYLTSSGAPAVTYDASSNSVNCFYSYYFRSNIVDLYRIMQNVTANYKINKFIELDYKYGVDHSRYDYESLIKNQTATPTSGMGISPVDGQLMRRGIQETQQNSLLSAIGKLDFEQDFGMSLPIQSTTLLAYDWRNIKYQRIDAIGTGLGVDPPYNLNFSDNYFGEDYASTFITFGYLINQKFDYGNYGGISGGFRSDLSSEFGEAQKRAFFPRFDGYVRINEFVNIDWLYELKLRAAYGKAGIQPSVYTRQITLSPDALGTGGYLYLPGISHNPELEVEITEEIEFGLDYGLYLGSRTWLNKASGSLVYWTRNSYGSIYSIGVAPSTGASGIVTNAVDLESNGIQLSLNMNVIEMPSFDWKFSTNFTKGLSKVKDISNGKPIVVGTGGEGQTFVMAGEPVGAFFGLEPLSSFDQTNSLGERYIAPEDVDDYEIVMGYVVNKESKQVQFTTEQVRIGDATPKFSLSFFNDFVIAKNLTLTAQIDWVYGAQAYNQTRQWLYRDRLHEDFDKEVTINGETGAFVAFWSSLYATNSINSHFVEDASYIRFRNIALSYDFGKLMNLPYIKGLVLTISARNLFTISDYTGIDPEA
ncbi:MAG: SusC/RagA family TonB-linked outer membrane protein, partial [Bacteroidales bacterium]|nr:SusC/RagA family TonB-linked outer membrane protein [Bacteroidales bacterium]